MKQRFNHAVQQLCLLGVGCTVINLFSAAAADNQSAGFQLLEVVGDGRTAHLHHSGKVDHTFFAVAQKPEDTDAAAVAKLLEKLGNRLKAVSGMAASVGSGGCPWSWGRGVDVMVLYLLL